MKSIMLIDDDRLTRLYMSRILENLGYQIRQAENGRQAIARVIEDGMPHLMVVDIFMPEMDGIETITYFKEYGRACPILAISSGGSEGNFTYLGYARTLGADGILEKPFSHDEFLSAVQALLG